MGRIRAHRVKPVVPKVRATSVWGVSTSSLGLHDKTPFTLFIQNQRSVTQFELNFIDSSIWIYCRRSRSSVRVRPTRGQGLPDRG
ncbi:hypothetical protein AVEN_25543-1, partial [Araneus ventricosus]